MGDGLKVNLREVISALLWLGGAALILFDAVLHKQMSHLTAYGAFLTSCAVTVTVYCIAVRHLDATRRELRNAFQLGRDSVIQLPHHRDPSLH